MTNLFQPDPYTTYSTQQIAPENTGLLHHMSAALQDSVNRVLSLLVSILPGVLAFILAVALLTALGVFLSWVIRKVLVALKFDEKIEKNQTNGIADFSPGHSPTALAGRIAFWSCVLLGLIIGVLTLDTSYQAGTGAVLTFSLLPYLTHAIGAILILFVGNLIARFLARTVLIGAVNNQLQYARFLSMGVKWLVLVLAAAMALEHLGVGGAIIPVAFGILFGGIVLTLALAIGLGSRDLVSRSLERTANPERPFTPPTAANPTETLRHF
jgi:hypothetical protein